MRLENRGSDPELYKRKKNDDDLIIASQQVTWA